MLPVRLPPDVALEQASVLSRRQAMDAGISSSRVGHLVRSGRWRQLHPGVYLTHSAEPDLLGRAWAALLHAGHDAVLSHRTAGHLQGLVDDPPSTLELVVPDAHRVTARPGVRVRRSLWVEQRRHPSRTPPQTRVEDTVLDLVESASQPDEVVGWLTASTGRRLTTAERLRQAADRRSRLRHRQLVAEVLHELRAGVASPLEHRYRRDVERAHGLPGGRCNLGVTIAGRRRYRDVVYLPFGVSVELDGLADHAAHGLSEDHRRDNASLVDDVLVLRYGWRDVVVQPCRTAGQVSALLRRRGWSGRPRRCGPGCRLAG